MALKASDCSIAMANGSSTTKNISQLVLLNSNFSAMPKVVLEGRRTINNIERSASLFLVKTIYSCIFAIMFLIMQESYPFMPIQLTLISVITIGIPSFMLALEPNKERIKGKFLNNVVSKALPTAITDIICIFILTLLHKENIISYEYFSSLSILTIGIVGITLLFSLAKSRKSEHLKIPFSIYRLVLAICMTLLFIIGLFIGSEFFGILDFYILNDFILVISSFVIILFVILNLIFSKFFRRKTS